MSADQSKEIRVVVYTSNVHESETLESQVVLPGDAEFAERWDESAEVTREMLNEAGVALDVVHESPVTDDET